MNLSFYNYSNYKGSGSNYNSSHYIDSDSHNSYYNRLNYNPSYTSNSYNDTYDGTSSHRKPQLSQSSTSNNVNSNNLIHSTSFRDHITSSHAIESSTDHHSLSAPHLFQNEPEDIKPRISRSPSPDYMQQDDSKRTQGTDFERWPVQATQTMRDDIVKKLRNRLKNENKIIIRTLRRSDGVAVDWKRHIKTTEVINIDDDAPSNNENTRQYSNQPVVQENSHINLSTNDVTSDKTTNQSSNRPNNKPHDQQTDKVNKNRSNSQPIIQVGSNIKWSTIDDVSTNQSNTVNNVRSLSNEISPNISNNSLPSRPELPIHTKKAAKPIKVPSNKPINKYNIFSTPTNKQNQPGQPASASRSLSVGDRSLAGYNSSLQKSIHDHSMYKSTQSPKSNLSSINKASINESKLHQNRAIGSPPRPFTFEQKNKIDNKSQEKSKQDKENELKHRKEKEVKEQHDKERKELIEKERVERERVEKQKKERLERLERERIDRERIDKQKKERLERQEQERLEKEIVEKRKKELEKQEKEKDILEKEKLEKQRKDKIERLEKERKERLERERLEELEIEKRENERNERYRKEEIEKEKRRKESLQVLQKFEKDKTEESKDKVDNNQNESFNNDHDKKPKFDISSDDESVISLENGSNDESKSLLSNIPWDKLETIPTDGKELFLRRMELSEYQGRIISKLDNLDNDHLLILINAAERLSLIQGKTKDAFENATLKTARPVKEKRKRDNNRYSISLDDDDKNVNKKEKKSKKRKLEDTPASIFIPKISEEKEQHAQLNRSVPPNLNIKDLNKGVRGTAQGYSEEPTDDCLRPISDKRKKKK